MPAHLLIPSLLLYLATAGVLAFAALYSFRSRIMPYHEDFLGVRFEQLDPKVRQLMLALMRVSGVTFFALAAGLILLISFPFREGVRWAGWAIYVMLLVALVPMFFLTRRMGPKTPWPIVLAMIGVVVVAAALNELTA